MTTCLALGDAPQKDLFFYQKIIENHCTVVKGYIFKSDIYLLDAQLTDRESKNIKKKHDGGIFFVILYISGCFIVTTIYLISAKTNVTVSGGKNMIYVTLFCLGQNAGSLLPYVSVEFIPVSIMTALFMGSTMVFGVVLSSIILKEQLTLPHLLSVLTCLAGFAVLIVGPINMVNCCISMNTAKDQNLLTSNPRAITLHACITDDLKSLDFSEMCKNISLTPKGMDISTCCDINNVTFHLGAASADRNLQTKSLGAFIIGLTLPVLAGLGEAVSVICVKLIQGNIHSVHVLTFWFVLSGFTCSLLGMFAFQHDILVMPANALDMAYILGMVTASSGALICYILAMGELSASLMSIFSCTEIIANVILEYCFFKALQPMDGGVTEIIGAVVVTFGLLIYPVIGYISVKCKHTEKASKDEEIGLIKWFE